MGICNLFDLVIGFIKFFRYLFSFFLEVGYCMEEWVSNYKNRVFVGVVKVLCNVLWVFYYIWIYVFFRNREFDVI